MSGVRKGNLYDPEFQKASLYNNGEAAFIDNLQDLSHIILADWAVQMEM